MTSISDHKPPPGLILHRAAFYDFGVWLMLLGQERAFRERMLEPARLGGGESVLDIGCGTGSLAMVAKRQVGPDGKVVGLDASAEMLARAAYKAGKAGLDVTFKQAAAQSLPLPDTEFDVVTATLMLHHLPGKAREQCAREISRVLKPGGRVLAVDFAAPARKRWWALRSPHRHGHVTLESMVAILEAAGLKVVETGAIRRNLGFALATRSG
ncbi:MAG TPA: class I SAM-dependent methyltransferase [Bradyrhizobium sp.]|uniref:class I SAM-dependent methyltransferase n=1 Tax=Bradyrhizobium sp. TaxID=376 RepID=UPI002BF694A7|nr:class I SAM-dependent methyltransferase [Bradyrhizobium sp.]HLZ06709.1 class I SAM-dependent methyltransferase [Bradyrhizobium sp.]